jgi:hypothetical protein
MSAAAVQVPGPAIYLRCRITLKTFDITRPILPGVNDVRADGVNNKDDNGSNHRELAATDLPDFHFPHRSCIQVQPRSFRRLPARPPRANSQRDCRGRSPQRGPTSPVKPASISIKRCIFGGFGRRGRAPVHLRKAASGDRSSLSSAVILRSEPSSASLEGWLRAQHHPSRRRQEAAPQDDGGCVAASVITSAHPSPTRR